MYVHKFDPSFTCEIISETAKGYKVKQKEKRGNKVKETTQYYYNIDFSADKGIWKKVDDTILTF